MKVLKVTAQGLTTSFRMPHFVFGLQPTFEMPPPSTIFGLICSSLGDIVDPMGLAFAYHFSYQSRFEDLEYVHLIGPAKGKFGAEKHQKVMEGKANIFRREILFNPKLVLYINHPEWKKDFEQPHYTVALGRSQDLFTYLSVEEIELVRSPHAYFEHTLIPYKRATQVGQGVVHLLPRYIDYTQDRKVTNQRYLLLHQRVHSGSFWTVDEKEESFWVDPTMLPVKGSHLGLFFHTFVGEQDEA